MPTGIPDKEDYKVFEHPLNFDAMNRSNKNTCISAYKIELTTYAVKADF